MNSNTPGGLSLSGPSAGQVSLVAGVMGKAPEPSSCVVDLKMHRYGFRVYMLFSGHVRPANTYTRDEDINLMPNIDVNSPASSAPTDRLALGVGWVRPGVASMGGSLNPSVSWKQTEGCCSCFEGSAE